MGQEAKETLSFRFDKRLRLEFHGPESRRMQSCLRWPPKLGQAAREIGLRLLHEESVVYSP